MNYRIFYKLIREFVTGKISRERFVYDWEQAQKNSYQAGGKLK
jgi:hypothetical protein